MCFVPTFVDSTARSQNLVLLNIQVVKCEYDEICSPAEDSEYYGMGLGYVFSFKWRILSQPTKIGSGKNKKIFIFPTGLEDHDLFISPKRKTPFCK